MCPGLAFSTQRAVFYGCEPQLHLQGNDTIPSLLQSLVSALEVSQSASLGLSVRIENLLHEPLIHKLAPSPIFLFLLAIFRKFLLLCNAGTVLEEALKRIFIKA